MAVGVRLPVAMETGIKHQKMLYYNIRAVH
jgi:hypothetical protein